MFVMMGAPSVAGYVLDSDDFSSGDEGWELGEAVNGTYQRTMSGYGVGYNCFVQKFVYASDQSTNFTVYASFYAYKYATTHQAYVQFVTPSGTTLLWSNTSDSEPFAWEGYISVELPPSPGYLQIGVKYHYSEYSGSYSANTTIVNATFEVASEPSWSANLSLVNEESLEGWSNFTAPWEIEVEAQRPTGDFVTWEVTRQPIPIYLTFEPRILRADGYFTSGSTLYAQYRQDIAPSEGNLTLYLSPRPAYVLPVIFTLVDYTSKFPPGTILKSYLLNGDLLTEEIVGADYQALLHLTYGDYYTISLAYGGATFSYGLFMPTSTSVTITVSSFSSGPGITMNASWTSSDTITATFNDETESTTYVSIAIRNSTGVVYSEEVNGSSLVVVRNGLNSSVPHWADFLYTSGGQNYSLSMRVYGNETPSLPSAVEFPFADFFDVPTSSALSFLLVIFVLVVFPSPYARYSAVLGSSLLALFSYWGWIQIRFEGAVALMVLCFLWAMMVRGRL